MKHTVFGKLQVVSGEKVMDALEGHQQNVEKT